MQDVPSRRKNILVLLLFVAAFAALSTRSGPEASWDLRNYHLYNPFAVLHGKLGFDIAPAQIQTFNAPQLDLIYYGLRSLLAAHTTLLDAIFSLPQAVGAFLTWRIARLFLGPAVPARDLLGVLVAGLGATGACALPTFTGAGSEMVPGCLCLLGLLLLLTQWQPEPAGRSRWRLAWAGALFGAAAGLKLTTAAYGAGAMAAVLIAAPAESTRRRLLSFALFTCGLAGGLIVIAAPWWLTLARFFGSPLFPYFNNIFRSPLTDPVGLSDDRFKPAGLARALLFPFSWAVRPDPAASEPTLRDPRLALAWLAALVAALGLALRRRSGARLRLLLVYVTVSFAAWEWQFSVLRYLAPVEFLTPVLVLAAVQPLGRQRWLPWAISALFAAAVLPLTTYPEWGHARRSGPAVRVTLPPLAPDATVLLLDASPMAYVAVFAPPTVRFVGVANNIIEPWHDTGLARQAAAAVRDARGELWGLDNFLQLPGYGDGILTLFGLHHAGPCFPVTSNIDLALRLCPLARNPVPAE